MVTSYFVFFDDDIKKWHFRFEIHLDEVLANIHEDSHVDLQPMWPIRLSYDPMMLKKTHLIT